MPGCTFNVSGVNFDVDSFLEETEWEANYIYRKGEVSEKPEMTYEDSGFSMTVSNSDGFLFEELEDVENFIDNNLEILKKLKSEYLVDEISFDFGYYCRLYDQKDNLIGFCQGESIEPSILQKCGNLGIRIDLSLYTMPEEGQQYRDV